MFRLPLKLYAAILIVYLVLGMLTIGHFWGVDFVRSFIHLLFLLALLLLPLLLFKKCWRTAVLSVISIATFLLLFSEFPHRWLPVYSLDWTAGCFPAGRVGLWYDMYQATWSVSLFSLFVPIDIVWHSYHFRELYAWTYLDGGSNHLPVLVWYP